MRVIFARRGWTECLHWASADARVFGKVNDLIEDIRRSPFKGIGKPEPLRNDKAGWWSRRITEEDRIIYRVRGRGEDQQVEIAQCRFHY